jgi:hypothetical protein
VSLVAFILVYGLLGVRGYYLIAKYAPGADAVLAQPIFRQARVLNRLRFETIAQSRFTA